MKTMKKKMATVLLALAVAASSILGGCGAAQKTGGRAEGTERTKESDATKESKESTAADVENSASGMSEAVRQTESTSAETSAGIDKQNIANPDNTENDGQGMTNSPDGTEGRKWMAISTKQYLINTERNERSEGYECFFEYDELGRLSKAGYNAIAFQIALTETDYYTYEYEESGEIKMWYSGWDENRYDLFTLDGQGRCVTSEFHTGGKKYPVKDYTHYEYDQWIFDNKGKSYNCIITYQETPDLPLKKYPGNKTYSKYKIGEFAVPLYSASGGKLDITEDEYGNAIAIHETTGYLNNRDYYFKYVYCTLDEYFAAKASGDFGGLQTSSGY